jgi:Fur family ferric uptake transcriptional regulator
VALRGKRVTAPSIEAALRQQGLRLTRQRRILLELLERSGAHLDADRLYRLARERDPKINRVTVYRTLKLLKATGLVDELDLMHWEGEAHYYETRMKQEHAHVVCLRCGKVEEYYGEPLRKMRRQIENHLGFQVLMVRTEVGGYCSHCRALRARELEAAAQTPPTRGATRRQR